MEIVDKLLESFDVLESNIDITARVLRERQDVPAEVVARVEQYREVLAKQRLLAENLRVSLASGNKAEAIRLSNIINALSELVRDDATSILQGAQPVVCN